MFSSLFEYLLTKESCERKIISHENKKMRENLLCAEKTYKSRKIWNSAVYSNIYNIINFLNDGVTCDDWKGSKKGFVYYSNEFEFYPGDDSEPLIKILE